MLVELFGSAKGVSVPARTPVRLRRVSSVNAPASCTIGEEVSEPFIWSGASRRALNFICDFLPRRKRRRLWI